jgi:hypothetical protein
MDAIECPGCKESVPLSCQKCALCGRAWDAIDLDVALRKDSARRYRLRVLAALAFAAVAALAASWTRLTAAALRMRGQFASELAKAEANQKVMGARPAVDSAAATPDPAPPAAAVYSLVLAPPSSSYPPGSRAEPEPAAAPAPAPEPVAVLDAVPSSVSPPAVGVRRIHGVVYDLLSKKPIRGAKVLFHGQGDSSSITDALGHYSWDVSAYDDREVKVECQAAGYRRGQLEEREPPLRERNEAARRAVLAETAPSDLTPALLSRTTLTVVEHDMVLIPESAK